jgi:hypothetical protein
MATNAYTQVQEEVEVCVQEGMRKKRRKNEVFACRVCLLVWEQGWGWGWGDGIAGVQGRIRVYTRSRISSKIPILASNLSTLV